MHVLGWIILGLIAGAIAKLLHRGPNPGGLLATLVLGLGGALLGGAVGRSLGLYGPDEGAGYIVSIIGAMVILAIYSAIVGRRRLGGAT